MQRLLFALAAALAAGEALASCGATFCMVNTGWQAQGAWTEPGVRLDLRYEYIDQDQARAGSRRVDVGRIPQHHDEVRSLNRNWVASLDWGLSPEWGVTAALPVVSPGRFGPM